MTGLPMPLHAVVIALLVFDVFWLPGYGITRRAFPTARALETMCLSLAFGAFGVAFVSFAIAAITKLWLTPVLILVVANTINLANSEVLLADLRRARAALAGGAVERRKTRRVLGAALLLFVLPFIVFALRWSQEEFNLTCIHYAPAYATGVQFGDGDVASFEQNEVLSLDLAQREGNGALIAAWPALFAFLGFRLFYATTHLISFVFAFLIGHQAFGRKRYGAFFAVLLTMNPLVAGIPETDHNLMVMACLLVAIYLVVGRQRSFLGAGAFFALAFGCMHVMLIGVGAFVLRALTSDRPARALGRFALGFAGPALFFAIKHLATYGSLLAHESFRHFPEPVPHRLFGWSFELHSVLAWPFTPDVLRSPFNPLPALLQYGLALPVYYGTVLTALVLIGVVVMARRRRGELAFMAALGLPVLGLLMVQGNWSESDKIRILVMVLAPLSYPVLAGAQWVARVRGRGKRAAVLVGVAALAVAQLVVANALLERRFGVDPREYIGRPTLAVETKADYERLRAVDLERPGLLPSIAPQHLMPRFFMADAWREVREELADPSYEARAQTLTQRLSGYLLPELYERLGVPRVSWRTPELTVATVTETQLLEISLATELARSEAWIRPVTEDDALAPEGELLLDAATTREDLVLTNVTASAFPGAVDVLVLRDSRDGQEMVMLAIVRRPEGRHAEPPRPLAGDRLWLKVNKGTFVVAIYFVNLEPRMAQAWFLMPDRDGGSRLMPVSLGG